MVSSTMLGSGGLLITQVAMAQDKPSAAELLDRGSRLYEQKQYAEAKTILVDIDPAQLPEDLRAKRADLLKNVDMALAKSSGPNAAFDAAEANLEADKYAAAASGFQALIDDPATPAQVKTDSQIKLAVVKDKQTAKAPQMKELLKQAENLYKQGKLDEAQNALTTIQATGSDLGWQDNAKPAQLQAQIDAARTAAGRGTPAPGTTGAVVAAPTAGTGAAVAPAPGGMTPAPAAVAPAPAIDPNSPMGMAVGADVIARQRAQQQFNRAMDDADKALKQTPPGYEAALQDAHAALNALSDNRRYFSDSEASLMQDSATRLEHFIVREQAATEATDKLRVQEQTAKLETARQKRLKQDREQKIHDLIKSAEAFHNQQQYREEADSWRQVLVIDPTDDAAKFNLQQVTERINYREFDSNSKKRAREGQLQSIDSEELMIPYTDLMVYPENWVELSRTRIGDQSNADTPANRAVRDRLDANIGELKADQKGLEQVIDYLRTATNTNIFVNWTALGTASITKDTPVSVSLKDVPFRKALNTVLSEAGGGTGNLGYTIDDGVITISTKDDLNSAKYQLVKVFDIRDMLVQPDQNINPPTFNLQSITSQGTTTGGSAGGGGGTGGATAGGGGLFNENGQTNNQMPTKTADDIAKDIIATITSTVAPDSWKDSGGTIGSIRQLNGQLIVNQTADNQTAVYNLLQQLRETRALQIAIEARMLLVDNSFLDTVAFGWNMTLPAGMLGNNVGGITIGNNTNNLAIPTPTGVPGSLGTTLGATNNSLSISGSIIDNLTLNLILTATQADSRTVTVTAPRVTLFNGQSGYIAVTQQQNFVSNFSQTVAAGGGGIGGGAVAVGTTLQVSTLTTGVVLFVNATVSSDRRYVVMKLQPQLSTLDGIDTFSANGTPVNTGANSGANAANGQTAGVGAGFVQLPRISYTTVDTMVSVPDGGTLLIGGEKLIGESEIEVGVPVLSKIPGLSRLFTNRSMVKDERTLLILVRPKIIIQKEIETDLFGPGYDKPTGLPIAAPTGDRTSYPFSVGGNR
jgi:general secretion pathway protein D